MGTVRPSRGCACDAADAGAWPELGGPLAVAVVALLFGRRRRRTA